MPAAAIDLNARLLADDIVETADERDALAAVRDVTGERDGPFERHGIRCFLLAEELAAERSLSVDRELLLIAGLLHDIGLYPAASRGGVYVTDGKEFARDLLAGRPGWADEERLTRCLLAIERHHELRSQWDAGVEVEVLRRVDLTEVSSALVRWGIDRSRIQAINAAVPRDGFYRAVGGLLGHALVERPLTIPRIFIR